MAVQQFTDVQLANAAKAAGFSAPKGELMVAVAVALAESGGRNETGDIDVPHRGCRSYGPWQVNSCPTYPRGGPSVLLTLDGNARAAYAVYKAQGWKAWTMHRNGRYSAFIARANAAIAKTDPNYVPGKSPLPGPAGAIDEAVAGGVDAAAGVLDAIAGPFEAIGKFLAALMDPATWLRIVEVVAGGAAIVVGFLILSKDTLGDLAKAAVV